MTGNVKNHLQLGIRSGWWSLNIITVPGKHPSIMKLECVMLCFQDDRYLVQDSVFISKISTGQDWTPTIPTILTYIPFHTRQAEQPIFVAELPAQKKMGNLIAVCTQIGVSPGRYEVFMCCACKRPCFLLKIMHPLQLFVSFIVVALIAHCWLYKRLEVTKVVHSSAYIYIFLNFVCVVISWGNIAPIVYKAATRRRPGNLVVAIGCFQAVAAQASEKGVVVVVDFNSTHRIHGGLSWW